MTINSNICKELNESEIISKSLENMDYFACLYERYETSLLRYIKRMSRTNNLEAEDILQDSFIKIWHNLNEFDSSLKLSSWLYRIVHNETISFCRKKRSFGKDNVLELDDNYIDIPEDETNIEFDPEEKFFQAHEILDKLPVKYKETLILRFFEKMSYEEISDILKLPEGTVATRINRAKQMFRKIAGREKQIFNS